MVRYGIIGVGMMGREHLCNLFHLRNEGATVVSVADPHVPSQKVSQEFADSFGWSIKVHIDLDIGVKKKQFDKNKKMVRYGIIGVGMMGREHLCNLFHLRNEGATVVSVADPHVPSQKVSQEFADSFGWSIKVRTCLCVLYKCLEHECYVVFLVNVYGLHVAICSFVLTY
nr:oxidoreductase family protein [Tanacetum cinerariifolium]